MLDEYSVDHYLADTDVRHRDALLFHYAKAESLETILASGNIRLNTLDGMNDPRERKDWIARGLVVPEGDLDWAMLAEQGAVAGEPNRLLRLGARIACFTRERQPLPGADADSLFHRGWARARMWHQYAAEHTGACLVFEPNLSTQSTQPERSAMVTSSPSAQCSTSTSRCGYRCLEHSPRRPQSKQP